MFFRSMFLFAVGSAVAVMVSGGCVGAGGRGQLRDDALQQKDRIAVAVSVRDPLLEGLGDRLRNGAVSLLEDAGPVKTLDPFTYRLAVDFEADVDRNYRGETVGYLDVEARVIRTVDNYIVVRKHFWESYSLKSDGKEVLQIRSERLGKTIAKWALDSLP